MIFVKPGTLEVRQYTGDTPDGFVIFTGVLVYADEDKTELAMNPSLTDPYLIPWDGAETLVYTKNEKIKETKIHAAKLIYNIYPFVPRTLGSVVGFYDYTTDMYLTTIAAAREPLTGRLLELKNIHDAAVDIIAEINALTTIAEVEAYDVEGSTLWP